MYGGYWQRRRIVTIRCDGLHLPANAAIIVLRRFVRKYARLFRGPWRITMQESNRKSLLLRMPVLPLRGMMVFPHMVLHFDVGRP